MSSLINDTLQYFLYNNCELCKMCNNVDLLCHYLGCIDVGEIRQSLQTLGVKVSIEEASRILQRFVIKKIPTNPIF